MKNFNKILLVLLVIFVITSAFVFSASAEDEYSLSGEWVLNLPLYGSLTQNINFVSNGVNYSKINYQGNRNTAPPYAFIQFDSQTIYHTNGGWTNENYKTVDFGETPQVVSKEFYDTFITIATQIRTECDGSCGVADENLDGICEDCGAPFSFRNTGYTYNHIVTFNTSEGVIEANYMSNNEFTIRGYIYGSSYRVDPSIDVYCIVYLNGEITYQGLVANHYPSSNLEDTVTSSTFDWYTSSDSGDVFFPLPLWEITQGITEGEIPQFNQTLGGNLTILTLCGIGCLTLLMALVLLSKTFRTFRVR